METLASSNYEKFQTWNPLVRLLIDRLYSALESEVGKLGPESMLDAGCGEGELLARLGDKLPARTEAVDISPAALELTRERCPGVRVSAQSIEALRFPDRSFELVVSLEVLEHMPEPDRALAELERVCARDLIVSVPHEPWFQIGSLLRAKYLAGLGNHPEHVNHFSPDSLREFLGRRFEVVSVRRRFPWLIARCRKRNPAPTP